MLALLLPLITVKASTVYMKSQLNQRMIQVSILLQPPLTISISIWSAIREPSVCSLHLPPSQLQS